MPAKTQVHLGAFGHVAGVDIDQLFKYLRSFIVILLLKSSHTCFKILDGSLVLNVDLRPFGNWGRYGLMPALALARETGLAASL